ncbi:S9 family peptidase [Cytobacillus purgationiresistens]|uniref:Dipeptidyl aminopeptidase/acylaminoacyl peptidase n=1 Tax=Cytobacillus purgationiresistens TaxID=863449 RepID=A0ABU0ADJ2_9BACI|nr:S9 family peptidase [Cytobacillus purgationiresistens]MDQ0268806.1 dipeptidyl aminopeptidase/acylaminoacyl peptidase [Cytobacillus purgationiresistens]
MSIQRNVKPEDLFTLKSVTDPQLSSNGRDCVFVETVMIEEKNTYSSQLFYLNVEEKNQPVQLTFGDNRNHSPRWSPDGNTIAFISDRADGKSQIFILSMSGGEARKITNARNGAANPVWSPDGTTIAFNVSLKNGESLEADGEKEREEEKKNPIPIEIEKMKHKSDAHGFWDGKYQQIAIVHVETHKAELLTLGTYDYQLQSWSPDGKYIAAGADLSENKDFSFQNDVYLIDPKSKEMKNITIGKGSFGYATWSPDSKHIGLLGQTREYENATLAKIWIYNLEKEELTCLTADWDVLVGDYVVADFQQGVTTPGILWGEDNNSFYFLATDHGNTVLYYGTLDGAMYPALLEPQQHIYGVSTGGTLDRAVIALSKPTQPGDLFLLNVITGEKEQLTNVNDAFLKEAVLADAEPFQFKSSDDWDIHGWMMKPANYVEGEKYPLVVEIHGGPHAMYANTYFHEFQSLAAEGYAVLFINPRGSHGYGQAFVDAVRGDYGGKDYEDIMEAVDYALSAYSFIDEERLGVTGGSYGGFMTNWMIGHTDRFKAAVTQRSISNWISFYGVSDIGYYFTEWQIKSDLNDIEKLWKHSPLAYVDAMDTPLLILHSEKDFRCPIEQAEQLFIALKHRKKETKFIRFPEANHELSRSGKPNLRISRLHYIINWFKDYLN